MNADVTEGTVPAPEDAEPSHAIRAQLGVYATVTDRTNLICIRSHPARSWLLLAPAPCQRMKIPKRLHLKTLQGKSPPGPKPRGLRPNSTSVMS